MTPSIARMVMARAGGAAPADALVHGDPELALRAHDARPQARALPVEHGHLGRARASRPRPSCWPAIFTLLDRVGLGARPGARSGSTAARCSRRRCAPACCATRPEAFAPLCVVIDKLDKIGADAVVEQLCDPAGARRGSRRPRRATWSRCSARAASTTRPPRRRADSRRDRRPAPALRAARRLRRRATTSTSTPRSCAASPTTRASSSRPSTPSATLRAVVRRRALRPAARDARRPVDPGGRLRLRRRRDRRAARRRRPAAGARRAASTTSSARSARRSGRRRSASRERLRARGSRRRARARRRSARSACSPTPTRPAPQRVWLLGDDEAARGVVKVRELATGKERDEP